MINHELTHSIATLKYRDKLIGTFSPRDYDKENSKYTISYNQDKSRAWHFWTSKKVFFKWETENKGQHGVDLEITDKNGQWTDKAVYTPIEIKK